jgi:hypothetical protein
MIMTSSTDTNNPDRAGHHAVWCGGSRSSGILCGLMLLVIGAIWIGKITGIIPLDMALFWPTVMVIAGAWILAGALLRRTRSS